MRRVFAAILAALLLLCGGCTPRPAPTATPTPVAPVATPSLPPLLTDEEAFAQLLDEVNAKNAAIDAPMATTTSSCPRRSLLTPRGRC